MNKSQHVISLCELDIKTDWQQTKERNPNLAKATGAVSSGAKKAATGTASTAKKVGAHIAADHQRGNKIRHARKLQKIERKKERVAAKHQLKMQKKKQSAEAKAYKYDPLVH